MKLSASGCIGHSIPKNRRVFGPLLKMGRTDVAMHRNVALLTRLEQIAAQPCPCEERAAYALTLIKADIARLYAWLGIGASNRIDIKAKVFADNRLADLRNRVLRTEVHTPAPSRPIFTAVRHHIEMIRRVLASRIAEDRADVPPPAPVTDPYWVSRAWRYIPANGSVDSQDVHRSRRARFGSLRGQLTI
ncbi:MAG: hypothetical protein WA268_02430 [Xanthobacteraceae bacterium]